MTYFDTEPVVKGTSLEAFNPWLHYVAGRLLPWSHPDHDDVVQEGRIAMWKAIPTYDGRTDKGGSLEGWLRMVARRRMLEIAYRRKPPTGTIIDRNVRRIPGVLSLDELCDESPGLAEEIVPCAPDIIHEVEIAYHRGEFLDALTRLTETQRRYVVLRFWGGLFELHNQGSPEQRKLTVELAPEFADIKFRKKEWLAAKADLEQYLSRMRSGYGD